MSCRITLRSGDEVLIDEVDEYLINSYTWTRSDDGYAIHNYTARGSSKAMYMHRLIMKAKVGEIVDHIDGNRLNNKRSNLRVVSVSQNSQNSYQKYKSTSMFKGVSWDSRLKKWRVDIRVKGRKRFLGKFEDVLDAALAYDVAALEFYGNDAMTNETYLKRILEKMELKKLASKK
jgi:hypothetical protein